MRRLARRLLRLAKLRRVRQPTIVDIMARRNIETVLDVGANDGGFATELREAGYTGRIISFEPILAVFNRLERRAVSDPNWTVLNLALGEEEGEQDISVAESEVFSSFLQPTDYSAKLWKGIAEVRRETVRVRRLDSVLTQNPEYLRGCFLKLDVQGFEMPVLRGAGKSLSRFELVQAELAFKQLYRGQECWLDVVHWITERGFEIVLAEANGVDWQEVRLLEMDFVFARAERQPMIDYTNLNDASY